MSYVSPFFVSPRFAAYMDVPGAGDPDGSGYMDVSGAVANNSADHDTYFSVQHAGEEDV